MPIARTEKGGRYGIIGLFNSHMPHTSSSNKRRTNRMPSNPKSHVQRRLERWHARRASTSSYQVKLCLPAPRGYQSCSADLICDGTITPVHAVTDAVSRCTSTQPRSAVSDGCPEPPSRSGVAKLGSESLLCSMVRIRATATGRTWMLHNLPCMVGARRQGGTAAWPAQ
jgi:hypothetical protein